MLDTHVLTTTAGHRVRFARLGSGPPLFLLHGYPENLQIFCRLAPLLAERFEVFAFDWPGMGASEEWGGGASPTDMARRAVALMDEWDIGRAHLVGQDMGGQPALVAAARFAERVESVVVMNSLLQHDAETSWEIRVLRKYGWNRFLIRRFPRAVFRRAERTFLERGVRLDAELRRDLWGHFREPRVRAHVSRMCGGFQGMLHRLPAICGEIACPVLALWGERDRHFPPVHAERLCEHVPHARARVLAGAGHWMAWTDAERVASAVLDELS